MFAQRYRADGTPVGGEFQVNSLAAANQRYSTVAIDPDGDFVITWSALANDTDNLGVYARRYNAAGVPQGEEFLVSPENTSFQRLSVAALDADGNLLIAWSELDPAGGENAASNIRARLFNEEGVALGPSFQVNTTTANQQRQASVARNEQGQFVIVWRSREQDGDTDGVFARVYAADGTPLTGELQINQAFRGQQIHATVAMDPSGSFVVAWYNQLLGDDSGAIVPREVYARRFAATGAPLGNEFRVNTTTAGDQRFPSIAVDQDGDFVIAWSSFSQDTSDWGIYAQAFDTFGAMVGEEFLVNTTLANRQIYPAVAMDDEGDFVVAWQSLSQDGDGYGVYAQRYTQPLALSYPLVTGVYVAGDDHAISEGERLVQEPSQLVIPFSEAMRTGGVADSVTNQANWELTRNGVVVNELISVIGFAFNATANRYEATLTLASPLSDADYVLTAKSSMRDAHGFNLDGDHDGQSGGAFQRSFRIALPVAVGDEFRVNTATSGDQLFSSAAPGTVAMDEAGDFIVVWTSSGQDGSGHGIYAQRFFANGAPNGGEFRVNTFTSGDQRLPTVAVDPRGTNGAFIVIWTSALQDGSSDGVYAQLFAADGARLGNEFRVNTTTVNAQSRSSVAMDHDGNFVIAWESFAQDGTGAPGVYFQRFAADGTKLGAETRANTFTTDAQRSPQVALDADGDFVITWSSNLQDGNGYGVYVRRFTAAGVPLGGEFRVNAVTAGKQFASSVAMDDDGDFAVVWESENVDGSSDGVLLQRYLANGTALGSSLLVNSTTTSAQRNASVAIDDDGDLVVTWQSLLQDGNLWGVYARRVPWNGTARTYEIRVNSTTFSSQLNPNVAIDADGDFVIAWSSQGQDGSGQGIYAQRYRGFVNSPPVADAGAPYLISEGHGLALSATGSFDPDAGQSLTYSWDVNNDGVFGDATGVTPVLTWLQLNALGVLDDGDFTVRLRVTDSAGAESEDAASLTILDVAPGNLALTAPAAIVEGAFASLSGSFTDPGTADAHQVTINWGDGSIVVTDLAPGILTFAFSHVYVDDNPTGTSSDQYPITVTVTGDGASSAPAGTVATVSNVAPQIALLETSASSISEGNLLTVSGSFNDLGLLDTHAVLISWGDGTASTGIVDEALKTFTAAHVYGDEEPAAQPTITVTLTDDDGGAAAAQTTVTVLNSTPQINLLQLSSTTIVEGGSVTLTGSYSDPGLLDTHTVLVGWGDGAATIATVNTALHTFTATHTYLDDNPTGTPSDIYPINVTITDDDNGVGTAQTSVTVQNVAPSNLVLDPLEAYLEGSVLTLTGRFDDPGTLDVHRAVIDWGDGNTSEIVLPAGARSFSAPHRYLDDNHNVPYVANVTITDDDGSSIAASREIFISNAPPEIVDLNATPSTINEGGIVTVTGRYADPSPLLPDGLVARYDFNGNAADLSGFGNDADVHGATLTTDRFGRANRAYLFDGNDDFIRIPESSAFDSTAFSISLWFRAESFPAQAGMLISKGQNNFEIHTAGETGADAMTFLPRFSGLGVEQDWHTPPGAYALAEWTHVVGVYNPGIQIRFFVDGVELALTGPADLRNALDNQLDARLGMRTDGTVAFHGAIDDVRVYDRELSPDEVTQLFLTVPSADSHTVAIEWGDGSSSNAIVDEELQTFTATHQYLDDNPTGTASDIYPISVTLTDEDGGIGTAQSSVTVNNVAPTVVITAIPLVVSLGQPFTLHALASDVGVQDAVALEWLVTRNGVTVAEGVGEEFTFTPLEQGIHLFTLTGTDDDGGVGTAQIALEVGPCQLTGDTNGDCSVDLVDLNNVRNHFGETGLGAVDLSFNAPVAGTIADKDGLGTGFTHRLPGTGAALPVNDPNLDLEAGGGGRLRIRSTQADINGSVNLGQMEAPAVLVPNIGQVDFEVSARFEDIVVHGASDQAAIFIGTSATKVFRGGFHDGNTMFFAGNLGAGDFSFPATINGSISFAPGDDIELTISRRAGQWEMRWRNLSNPSGDGSYSQFQVPWLADEPELYFGVLHADARNATPQIATIDNFTIDILRPIPGDTNSDFIVDLSDLNAVRNNFGATFGGAPSATTRPDRQEFRVLNGSSRDQTSAADAVFAQWTSGDMDSPGLTLGTVETREIAFGQRPRPRRLTAMHSKSL